MWYLSGAALVAFGFGLRGACFPVIFGDDGGLGLKCSESLSCAAESFASTKDVLGGPPEADPRRTGLSPNLSKIFGLVPMQLQVRQSKNKPSIVPVVVIDAATLFQLRSLRAHGDVLVRTGQHAGAWLGGRAADLAKTASPEGLKTNDSEITEHDNVGAGAGYMVQGRQRSAKNAWAPSSAVGEGE